jgi:hypothetical protein
MVMFIVSAVLSMASSKPPRAWFERFTLVVTTADFAGNQHDPALFIHTSPRGRTLILLYVDDMLITENDYEYIAFVKTRLRSS